MIQPTASFKENLQLLASIEDLARIDLVDPAGTIVASIENQPGKQGHLPFINIFNRISMRLMLRLRHMASPFSVSTR